MLPITLMNQNTERSTRPPEADHSPRDTQPLSAAIPPREMVAALTKVYREAGLPEALALKAAQADMECEFGAFLALAA